MQTVADLCGRVQDILAAAERGEKRQFEELAVEQLSGAAASLLLTGEEPGEVIDVLAPPLGRHDRDVVISSAIAARLAIQGSFRAVRTSPPTPDVVELLRLTAKGTRVLRPPGARLLSLVDFVFSKKTAKLLRQPLLDLQVEYCEALGAQRPRKASWVRLRGYWSFWETVAMLMPVSLLRLVVQLWKLGGGG
jgi:hypothetical protein